MRHGRKDKPDSDLTAGRKHQAVELVSMPEYSAAADDDRLFSSESEESSEEEDLDPLGLTAADGPDAPSLGIAGLTGPEVTLLLLDWMCTHRVTDSAARDIWDMIAGLLGEDAVHTDIF